MSATARPCRSSMVRLDALLHVAHELGETINPRARQPMRLLTLLRQPAPRQRLVVEALGQLLRAWWLVRFRQFSAYAAELGVAHPGEYAGKGASDLELLRDIRWAVEAVNRSVGGRFTCLMQGMAGKAMLNRRGAPNSLVLGAKMGGRSDADATDGMVAHAWLRSGPVVLLGGEVRGGFAPITSYYSRAPGAAS